MKKIYVSLGFIIIIAVFAMSISACSSPPEDVQSADIGSESEISNSAGDEGDGMEEAVKDMSSLEARDIMITEDSFEFEGYTVGKSHIGSFDEISGKVYLDDEGKIAGMKLMINPATVNTGIDALDTHLKSDDFFDVEKYPEINVDLVDIVDGEATVDLDFRGRVREVSFDVVESENSISTEFMLDTTPFEMKYVGVNKEVRIKFNFKY